MIKIVSTTDSCGKCTHYSGGECRLIELRVLDSSVVSPFCPLPDYPAQIIAALDRTVHTLRKGSEYAAGIVLLNHIATKLTVPLNPNGTSLTLSLAEGDLIVLDLNFVTKFDVTPGTEVTFMYHERKFKLYPDAPTPYIEEAVKPRANSEELWRSHTITR